MESIAYQEKGNRIHVTARGEWNLANIREMEQAFSDMLAKKPGLIAINCKDLIGVDSTAIATLVKILRKAKETNIKLIFLDLNPSIQHTFQLMTLNKFFTMMTGERFKEEFGGVDER